MESKRRDWSSSNFERFRRYFSVFKEPMDPQHEWVLYRFPLQHQSQPLRTISRTRKKTRKKRRGKASERVEPGEGEIHSEKGCSPRLEIMLLLTGCLRAPDRKSKNLCLGSKPRGLRECCFGFLPGGASRRVEGNYTLIGC